MSEIELEKGMRGACLTISHLAEQARRMGVAIPEDEREDDTWMGIMRNRFVHMNMEYDDVKITINGETKTFTWEQFKTILGFSHESPEDRE